MRQLEHNGVAMTRSQIFQWALLFAVLALYLATIVQVHLFPDRRVLQQLVGQYRHQERMAMDRGTVFDRRGEPLALSVPAYSVFMDPGVEGWDLSSLDSVAPLIGQNRIQELRSQSLTRRFYWIQRYLTLEEARRIVDAGGKGFYIREERKRTYPKGAILSHVLGYCDQDGWGLAGVELKWNNVLFIPESIKTHYRGASPLSSPEQGRRSPAERGVYLTIDSDIQYAAERFLGPAVQAAHGRWGAVVCLDTQTGAVAAMASWPAFDPNDRSTFQDPRRLSNNAINRVYEPGSTFKPIITGIALDRGLLSTRSSFRCPARIKVADAYMSDAQPRDNGILTVSEIIEKSSNVGMAQIGLLFNPYEAYEDMQFWGLGRKTGILLNGEEEGLLLPPEQWYGVIPANVAIGQGFALTPLQLTAAFNAIANGGLLLRPYIVERAIDGEGRSVFQAKREVVAQVLSSASARWLRTVLRRVVEQGTGRPADTPVVRIAGKTGTAQIAEGGKYIKERYHASMIGFWPADAPQYTMLVLVGDVSGERYYGSQVAAPLFRAIVEEVERLQGVAPRGI